MRRKSRHFTGAESFVIEGGGFFDCMLPPHGGFNPSPEVDSTFTPTSISNLSLWLDAAQGVTDAGGGAVSAWADQSGAGHDLTQGSAGARPSLVTGVINGLPVVRFGPTASDKWMDFVDWAQASEVTVYAVVRYIRAADFQILLRGGGPHIYLGDTGANIYKPMTYGAGTAIATWGTALATTTNFLIRWKSNAATETVSVSVSNGADVTTVGTGVTAVNWQEMGLSLAIQDLQSDVAEVLIYDRALTAEENTSVTNYLNTKYGL